MRTTVNIDDALLQEARAEAVRSRRALGDVVDDALRGHFAARQGATSVVRLPRAGGGGLQPGVDLEDKDALATLLGDDAPR